MDTGSGFSNLSNGGVYSGAFASTLSLTGVPLGMSGYHYRCVVSGNCGTATSNSATLTVSACFPNIVYQSSDPFTQITGDGDAWFEKGEKWSVQVTLINAGTASANGVTANLAGNGITVCNNPGVFGSIAASGTASYTYQFVIDPAFAPCGGSVGFDIVNKACWELRPAGADELDKFTVSVGQLGVGSPTNLVIQPSTVDAWVTSAAQTTNYGTGATMNVQGRSVNIQRSLVKFDLSGIPAGATINSATLELYATAVPTAGQTLDVHRIAGTWTETGVTWTTLPTFTATADASVAGGTTTGWKIWNVLPVVQGWQSGTNANDGFLVKNNPETGSVASIYAFATRENSTAANKPILRVNYTPANGGTAPMWARVSAQTPASRHLHRISRVSPTPPRAP